ncbi:hypothetical protein B0H14DRAFT_2568178 [Mycena olivaceomarginata]|nr:hypothetical protein B0H14DRAFT_2568178 [Mycena olivaceomarginata]
MTTGRAGEAGDHGRVATPARARVGVAWGDCGGDANLRLADRESTSSGGSSGRKKKGGAATGVTTAESKGEGGGGANQILDVHPAAARVKECEGPSLLPCFRAIRPFFLDDPPTTFVVLALTPTTTQPFTTKQYRNLGRVQTLRACSRYNIRWGWPDWSYFMLGLGFDQPQGFRNWPTTARDRYVRYIPPSGFVGHSIARFSHETCK